MIYVMSDIHGQGKQFEEMMELIDLKEDDHLYILGDIVDRNPAGISLLQTVRRMKNVTMLLGNHELMMLDAIRNPDDEFLWRLWFQNGGMTTYDHYMELEPEERDAIIECIDGLPVNINITVNGVKYLLVHGVPIESCKITRKNSNVRSLSVWSRIETCDRFPEGKVIIFGHTPTENYSDEEPMRIWHEDNLIGIDCGCAYGTRGRLGCLRLDDMQEFYSSGMI